MAYMSHFAYIQDPDVHKDVKANKVKPSEYFILNFDFSAVCRSVRNGAVCPVSRSGLDRPSVTVLENTMPGRTMDYWVRTMDCSPPCRALVLPGSHGILFLPW